MILNVDYKFRDDLFDSEKAEYGDTIPIELMVGAFRGVVYRYTTVAIKELENGEPRLQFSYEILKTVEDDGDHSMTEDDLRSNEYFEKFIGTVLNAIMLDSLDIEKELNNADRRYDSEELDPE